MLALAPTPNNGSVITTLVTAVQPLPSTTLTVCVPAHKPVAVAVVWLPAVVLHTNV